jgi:hypothetical protein
MCVNLPTDSRGRMMRARSDSAIYRSVSSAATMVVQEIFGFSQKNRFSRLTVFFRRLPC